LRFPFNIYTITETSDLKFGTQLGFAKAYRKMAPREKSAWGGLKLGELFKILRFPYNISATAGAVDFKFGMHLKFAKAHHKTTPRGKWAWPWVMEAPTYLEFPFNISATAALSS